MPQMSKIPQPAATQPSSSVNNKDKSPRKNSRDLLIKDDPKLAVVNNKDESPRKNSRDLLIKDDPKLAVPSLDLSASTTENANETRGRKQSRGSVESGRKSQRRKSRSSMSPRDDSDVSTRCFFVPHCSFPCTTSPMLPTYI